MPRSGRAFPNRISFKVIVNISRVRRIEEEDREKTPEANVHRPDSGKAECGRSAAFRQGLKMS